MPLPSGLQTAGLNLPATTASDQQLAAATTSQVDGHFWDESRSVFEQPPMEKIRPFFTTWQGPSAALLRLLAP